MEFREEKDTGKPSMTDSEFEHKPFSLNVYLYREGEREEERGGEREKDNPKQAECCQHRA